MFVRVFLMRSIGLMLHAKELGDAVSGAIRDPEATGVESEAPRRAEGFLLSTDKALAGVGVVAAHRDGGVAQAVVGKGWREG